MKRRGRPKGRRRSKRLQAALDYATAESDRITEELVSLARGISTASPCAEYAPEPEPAKRGRGRPKGSKSGNPWALWQEVLRNPKKFSAEQRRQRLHRMRKAYEKPGKPIVYVSKKDLWDRNGPAYWCD